VNDLRKILLAIKGLPVISFLWRYWLILALLAIFAGLIFSNSLFAVVGMFIYIPALSLGSLAFALLLRNVFNDDTTDADADSGRFRREWDELEPKTRVTLTVVQILVYLFCVSIITAALASR